MQLNIPEMVAGLNLTRPMADLLTELSARAREICEETGAEFPSDFDQKCRYAIRERRGNPVPLARPAAARQKMRQHGTVLMPIRLTPKEDLLNRLRGAKATVLDGKAKRLRLREMLQTVAEIQAIFRLPDENRHYFHAQTVSVTRKLTRIIEIVQRGQATPEQVASALDLFTRPQTNAR